MRDGECKATYLFVANVYGLVDFNERCLVSIRAVKRCLFFAHEHNEALTCIPVESIKHHSFVRKFIHRAKAEKISLMSWIYFWMEDEYLKVKLYNLDGRKVLGEVPGDHRDIHPIDHFSSTEEQAEFDRINTF